VGHPGLSVYWRERLAVSIVLLADAGSLDRTESLAVRTIIFRSG